MCSRPALYRVFGMTSTLGCLLVVLLWSTTSFASAASLSIAPQTGESTVGSTINVLVTAASDAPAIRAVSGTLSFPTTLLEVVSVSKSQSLVSSWAVNPTFSNTAGTIMFSGTVPDPGYSGTDGRIVMVTFKVKAVGTANLSYSAGSIKANDGDGTEILSSKTGATYTLLPALAARVLSGATTTAAASDGAPAIPDLPQVTSDTHPDATWSHLATGTFNFVMASSVTALRLLADDKPTTLPTVTYAPPITSRTIPDLPEGISYLHVQYKTATGWGKVRHYKLQIDTTAPTTFTIREVSPGVFTFVSEDALSGILRYDITIDGGAPTAFVDDGQHLFTVSTLPPGTHTILVRALDAALNGTESSFTFTTIAPAVTVAEAAPALPPSDMDRLLMKGTFLISILSVVTPLIALILLIAGLLYVAWRSKGGIERTIAREVAEARLALEMSYVPPSTEFAADIALLTKASQKRKLTREETKILKHLLATAHTSESASDQEITASKRSKR